MSACWPLQMSPTQKLVLMSLADQANSQGICWPGIQAIAVRTCLSDRAVRKAIRDLENLGYVASQGRSGTSNHYTITPEPRSAPAPDSAPEQNAPTPAPDSAGGGTSCRSPRNHVPPNHKEPSLKPQEPRIAPSAKSADKPRKSKRSSLPENFEPNENNKRVAQELDISLQEELPQFIDWHLAKGSVMADWHRALNTWLRKANEFKGPKKKRDQVRACLRDVDDLAWLDGIDDATNKGDLNGWAAGINDEDDSYIDGTCNRVAE